MKATTNSYKPSKFELEKKLRRIEKDQMEVFEAGWPIFWVYVAIFWGILIGLSINILHDLLKTNVLYKAGVPVMTLIVTWKFIKYFSNSYWKSFRKLSRKYKLIQKQIRVLDK